jgi:hypothetical protein
MESLPVELTMRIFVYSQNDSLRKTCKKMYKIGRDVGTKALFLVHRYTLKPEGVVEMVQDHQFNAEIAKYLISNLEHFHLIDIVTEWTAINGDEDLMTWLPSYQK